MDATGPEQAEIQLPKRLTTGEAEDLYHELLDRRGSNLALNGHEVEFIGGLCLQVLVSAQKTWLEDNRSFHITDVSDRFLTGLDRLGARDCLTISGGEN